MVKTQRKGRSGEQSLTPFLDPLQAVQDLLDAFGERGVIIGGIAASLLGRPRFTADVDIESHHGLDKERIRCWVRQFAETLEMPELWDDLEARLK